MRYLGRFDPSTGSTTATSTFATGLPNASCWTFAVSNESNYGLIFYFQNGAQYFLVKPWETKMVKLPGFTPNLDWKIEYTLTASNPPVSLVAIEAYDPGESIPVSYSLTRVTNVGNPLTTSSSQSLITGGTVTNAFVTDQVGNNLQLVPNSPAAAALGTDIGWMDTNNVFHPALSVTNTGVVNVDSHMIINSVQLELNAASTLTVDTGVTVKGVSLLKLIDNNTENITDNAPTTSYKSYVIAGNYGVPSGATAVKVFVYIKSTSTAPVGLYVNALLAGGVQGDGVVYTQVASASIPTCVEVDVPLTGNNLGMAVSNVTGTTIGLVVKGYYIGA